MGTTVKIDVGLTSVAERLRVAAERMTDDNFHDWAFLALLAAECLTEAHRELQRREKDRP